jgi:hypothetical protein
MTAGIVYAPEDDAEGIFLKDTDPVMQGKAGFHNILFLVMIFVFLLQVFKKNPSGTGFSMLRYGYCCSCV